MTTVIYSPQHKALAAVIMYALCGEDLDAASSGTPNAVKAFQIATAVMQAGYRTREHVR